MKQPLLILLLFPFILSAQTQIGQNIDGEDVGDQSGLNIGISSDGNIIAIGARLNDGNGTNSGHVRVYENQSGIWVQVGQDIDGEAEGDNSGRGVSLSSDGNIVAIGAIENDDNGQFSGHVRVYENQGDNWIQIGQDIDGEAEADISGRSIHLSSDGNIIAIGAAQNNSGRGHVRVYENQEGNWIQIGEDIDGEEEGDLSSFRGTSVSISSDGNIVAIGAEGNDGNGNISGHVRVYENQEDTWMQIGQDIDGENAEDVSGSSVSLSSDGNIVAIGATGNNNSSGHVRVYENQSGNWMQIGQDIDGEAEGDLSGAVVSLSSDGNIVAIGAPFNGGNGANSGHARIYRNIGGDWIQIGQDIYGEMEGDISSAVGLSSDGTTLAIGAFGSDGNGIDSGHVRVFNLSSILSIDAAVIASFSMYPNPASDFLNIKLKDDTIELQNIIVYNNLGQLLSITKQKTIDISDLSKGIYFVQIITDKGNATKKLVVE